MRLGQAFDGVGRSLPALLIAIEPPMIAWTTPHAARSDQRRGFADRRWASEVDACPFELERAQEGCSESCCNGEHDARVAFRWLGNALPPFLERAFAADGRADLRGSLIDDEIGSAERTVWQHEIVAVPAEPGCGPGAWQIAALEIDSGAKIAMQRIGSGAPV